MELPVSERYAGLNRGEIVELGRHRLMCGDATSHEDISRLMQNSHAKLLFTSPPYSDIYIYGGNDISPEHLAEFIPASKDYADIMCVNLGLKKKNHEIIPYWNEYISAAHKCGLKLLSWNVWDKINPGSIAQQRFMFPLRHEFIFVFGEAPVKLNRTIPKIDKDFLAGKLRSKKTKMRERDGTIKLHTRNLQYNEKNKPLETVITQRAVSTRSILGTAQMPVELAEEYIKACTSEGDYVLDTFGGTGTTLIACERTNRKCFIMEINPESCQTIINRYKYTF